MDILNICQKYNNLKFTLSLDKFYNFGLFFLFVFLFIFFNKEILKIDNRKCGKDWYNQILK